MPGRPAKQYQQQQQPQHDAKKQVDRVKQMDRSEASSQASSRDTSRDNSFTREAASSKMKKKTFFVKSYLKFFDISVSGSNPQISEKASVVKRAYTTEEIERKVTNMVEEYLHNNDVAVSCC